MDVADCQVGFKGLLLSQAVGDEYTQLRVLSLMSFGMDGPMTRPAEALWHLSRMPSQLAGVQEPAGHLGRYAISNFQER